MGYDGMSISISRYLYYCFYCYYYCYITLPFLLWSVLVLLVLPYIIIKTITCCYCCYWSLSSLSDHVGKKNLSHQEKTVFPIDMAIPRGSIHVLRMAFGEWHSVGMGQNRSNFTTPCGHRTPNPTNLRDQDGNLTTRRGSFFARKALKNDAATRWCRLLKKRHSTSPLVGEPSMSTLHHFMSCGKNNSVTMSCHQSMKLLQETCCRDGQFFAICIHLLPISDMIIYRMI